MNQVFSFTVVIDVKRHIKMLILDMNPIFKVEYMYWIDRWCITHIVLYKFSGFYPKTFYLPMIWEFTEFL